LALALLKDPEWYDGGGHQSEGYGSYVPAGHGGPCAMGFYARRGQQWAVFSNYEQASNAAASACCWHIGGYSGVRLYPLTAAPLDARRFEWAADWLFGDEQLSEEEPQRGVFYEARIAMRKMLRAISERPDELLQMEWMDLERALFEALDGMGYQVRRTRSTKDGGYDLEVVIEERRYLVEVKHWNAAYRVGPDIVRHFGEVVLREQAHGGLVLSSSGYSGTVVSGRLEAVRAPVMLGDKFKMLSFCKNFVLSENGIWQRDRSLTEVFFADTYYAMPANVLI
jgi:hypothetical protein